MKLTQEEEEILELIMDTPEWWAVVLKVLDIGVWRQREIFCGAPAQKQEDGLELLLRKARLDGARAQATLFGSLNKKKRKREKDAN